MPNVSADIPIASKAALPDDQRKKLRIESVLTGYSLKISLYSGKPVENLGTFPKVLLESVASPRALMPRLRGQ